MKKSTLSSSSGFSLVELMVVVAIIGILAAMSVGSVQKQIAKARQSEAKTTLSALYSAEKAFQAEYSAYYTNLSSIAFSPEGNIRYNVGFGAASGYNASTYGFTGTGSAAPGTNMTALDLCAAAPGAGVVCVETPPATNAPALGAGTATATAFTAAASTDQLFQTNDDAWTVTENKTFTNTTIGIP